MLELREVNYLSGNLYGVRREGVEYIAKDLRKREELSVINVKHSAPLELLVHLRVA